MAGRNYTPVNFALEKNVVSIFGRVVFGSNGVPILDTNNSKGICAVGIQSNVFSGTTSSGSATIGSVSNFTNLFTGMTLSGGGATGTIGTMSATLDSIVMSALATSGTIASITATGGKYIFQFGTQAGVRLDGYAKLLDYNFSWDESTGSANGTGTTLQLAPSVAQSFIVDNNSSIRTIPSSSTSNSTDCTVSIQFGNGVGTNFVASNPLAGEVLRVNFTFGNSTAI